MIHNYNFDKFFILILYFYETTFINEIGNMIYLVFVILAI